MDPQELKHNFKKLDSWEEATKPPQSKPAQLPHQLQGPFAGRYQIVEKIGIGGMAALYKVRDLVVDEELAIKIIRPDIAIHDISHKRFRQEARAARDLNHPNIVSVRTYDVSDDGVPFMIMDFVDGVDLGKALRNAGPVAPSIFFPIFIQVSGALVHAHSRGVVHRDVKPSNILITTTEEGKVWVKLVDFGIAKLLSPEDENDQTHVLTKPGQTVGSPSYMSPEQVQGKEIDARSDIYSLGCVMFEALTGQMPFKATSALQLAMHHVYTQPDNLKKVLKTCPIYLDRIVAHCLEKRPEDRYQSMFDLRSDLQLVSQGKEPRLQTGARTSARANEDWFELIRKDSPKDFNSRLQGTLSYDKRLDNVLEQINELGYRGDSILKLQSHNPVYTGLIVIRDGRQVIGARIQGEKASIGYEALRKLISMADGEYRYFTFQSDDYSLPDSSMNLNLKYILSLYPNLPDKSDLEDSNAIRSLVLAVETNTRTDWQQVTPVDNLLNQLDNRDDSWRPMGVLKQDTPITADFLSREELLEALAQEAAMRASTAQKQGKLDKLIGGLHKRGTSILMILVFMSAMVVMGAEIFKATLQNIASPKLHIRKKRPGKRYKRHAFALPDRQPIARGGDTQF